MPAPTRDELATRYLDQLPYTPYPVQEEALLAWFTAEQGVLVCAPTGTGKTLIAQAALFEALHSNTVAYYTTPLIALTEQKFAEMQASAERWGFSRDDVGLVTGNRKVNPNARVLVVVAEILLNRLLHPEGFHFDAVSAVVMDEFHSFADPERGIVWELSLNMLPKHIRLLLLSATVGNSVEFLGWLDRCHGRKLELVEGRDRRVPLTYHWVPNEFLNDLLVDMARGDDAARKTPALVFAFNRDECWSIAEQLKGLDLLNSGQRTGLNAAVDKLDWPHGIGPRLKQLLRRGVSVHHAGLLPKYRRAVEHLFEKKLLSVCLCTETLAAGINLPARSVVLTSLVKGPFGKEKLIDPSTAHQIFGRAGRPQFDTEGHVYALPHEDDVRILKWKEKYDQIPETTKDPLLLKKKKELLRKKPSRNPQKK
jgi:superfamily II RNA helicase